MEFNFLVFDEVSVIAGFKYFDDAVAFANTVDQDFDIFDMSKGDVIGVEKIKKIISNGCV